MTHYEALCFRDICFALLWHTLNMQQVSLTYLKSLVNDNFQPESVKLNSYSGTTAMLIVFLSDEEHKCIEHVHIGLVVHHEECNLYMQDGILPLVKSIEADLKKVRDRCTQNKDLGRVHSYALLVANYGGIMAISDNPTYCLVCVISTVFESKDKPTQMTKQSFTIVDFITYRKSIHFELICKDVHN